MAAGPEPAEHERFSQSRGLGPQLRRARLELQRRTALNPARGRGSPVGFARWRRCTAFGRDCRPTFHRKQGRAAFQWSSAGQPSFTLTGRQPPQRLAERFTEPDGLFWQSSLLVGQRLWRRGQWSQRG